MYFGIYNFNLLSIKICITMPEWSKGEDLRSSGTSFRVGSNPTGDN